MQTHDGRTVRKSEDGVSAHPLQNEFVAAAIRQARDAYLKGGLGQVMLHTSDSTIREERTCSKESRGPLGCGQSRAAPIRLTAFGGQAS